MRKYVYLLTGIMMSLQAGAQVQSRLVAQAQFDYDGSAFSLADTFAYQYSGGRGSDMKTGIYKYDTSVYALGNQLKERGIQTFYYPGHELEVKITQNYVSGQWENYRKQAYYYNAQGAPDSVLEEKWNPFNKIWQQDKRITYTYDAQSRLTEYKEETWNNLTSYGPYRRILYVYTGTTLRLKTESFWDATAANWIGFEEHRYLYDGAGKLTSDSLQVWDNVNAVWQHELRTIYSYDGSGKLATLTEKDWDPVALALLTDYKHIYAYNAQNLLQYDTLFAWSNTSSSYEKSTLYINTYDAAGNLDINEEQYMHDDTFRHYRRKVWTYNSHNQPLTYNAYLWNATVTIYEPLHGNDTRIYYYYQEYDPAGIPGVATENKGFKVYPNPARSMVSAVVEGPAAVFIYDMRGALIKQWQAGNMAGQYTVNIPVHDIAPGQYLLRIATSNKQMTQSLLIAR